MSKKKSQGDKPTTPPRVKPMRMVRIPEAFAQGLERRAAKEYSDLTEQLRIAVKEFLEKHQELPPPVSRQG